MSVRIIIDSTADMPEEYRSRCIMVPLTVHFGREEFMDGITITREEFYRRLVESDVLPTTSQAAPAAFEDAYARVAADGDTAVVITLASKLSGTWQSAMIAARKYQDRVFVVDSSSGSVGGGILVRRALELCEQGMDAASVAAVLEKEKTDIRVLALLDTLEYLKRGGRISAATAFAGSLLSIKPVAAVIDGEIRMLGKARGSKQGNNLLVEQIEKSGGVDFTRPVLLGYSGLSDALLQKYIADSKYLWIDALEELQTTLISSVIGTHTGPGAIVVAFFAKR